MALRLQNRSSAVTSTRAGAREHVELTSDAVTKFAVICPNIHVFCFFHAGLVIGPEHGEEHMAAKLRMR